MIRLILSLLILSVLSFSANGQVKVHVVTKSIQKELAFKNGYELRFDGEMSDVTLSSWNKDVVKIDMQIISRHPDKSIAEKDLKKLNYSNQRTGKWLQVKSNVVVENGKKPDANIKVIYTIKVPQNCPVFVKNEFGNVTLKALYGNATLKTEFCGINFNRVKGKVNTEAYFGEISGVDIDGDVILNSNRADIDLAKMKGHYDITARLATIKVSADDDLESISVKADKSDVIFSPPGQSKYNYDLTTEHGKINVPTTMNFNITKANNGTQYASTNSSEKQDVNINTSYGKITIED